MIPTISSFSFVSGVSLLEAPHTNPSFPSIPDAPGAIPKTIGLKFSLLSRQGVCAEGRSGMIQEFPRNQTIYLLADSSCSSPSCPWRPTSPSNSSVYQKPPQTQL
ncbi:hypothetical protein D623_10022956 [Myotis brandtii]|uniref:Uncharacterized protein n=1 Tax=Myotis brandtii TaxID=109478 RepID=S7N0R3_MYOBR|nr:hypothetical protein D623_10022956 [Myotis brandtii]